MRPIHLARLTMLVTLILGAGLPVAGIAASDDEAAAELKAAGFQEIVIGGADYVFEGVPDTIEAGFTLLTMENTGADIHHAQLLRLNDGVTFDDVEAAWPRTLEEAEDPAVFERLFSLARLSGGIGIIAPGTSASVVLDLDPGTYVVVCGLDAPDGESHSAKGMITSFDVVEAEQDADVAPPVADITVTLQDFAFAGLTDSLPAGQHVLEVTNDGVEPHELLLFQLAPEATVEDLLMALAAPAAGPPPGMPAGGMQALDAGQTGWLILNLEPGARYVAVCFVPSPANEGQPHLALGMIAELTVAEEQ